MPLPVPPRNLPIPSTTRCLIAAISTASAVTLAARQLARAAQREAQAIAREARARGAAARDQARAGDSTHGHDHDHDHVAPPGSPKPPPMKPHRDQIIELVIRWVDDTWDDSIEIDAKDPALPDLISFLRDEIREHGGGRLYKRTQTLRRNTSLWYPIPLPEPTPPEPEPTPTPTDDVEETDPDEDALPLDDSHLPPAETHTSRASTLPRATTPSSLTPPGADLPLFPPTLAPRRDTETEPIQLPRTTPTPTVPDPDPSDG